MKDIGSLSSVVFQYAPGDAPLVWYGVLFLLALLVLGALIGFWLVRTESDRQAPIEHNMLLNAFEDPLVVLAPDDTVLIGNVPFRTLFDSNIEGEPISTVLESYPTLLEAIVDREQRVVTVDQSGVSRSFRVRTYPAGHEPRPPRKLVVHLQELTSEEDQVGPIDCQNEQLGDFATLVSHDLRNPLDVAIGHTTAIDELVDDPEVESHLRQVRDSHTRIQQIITDVLALAQDGHSIDETEPLSLDAVATEAWSYVDTDDAVLSVLTEQSILADAELLTHIFENLFRNAIQHGGDEITVEIDSLESGAGFFVADNGTGISPERREAVLEPGTSDATDGIGLGLAIVSSIAAAHNWNVTVTESAAGGARFEFTGVEFVSAESPPDQE